MKTTQRILAVLFFVSAFIFVGCNKDDDPVDMPEPTNTIVDIASADANFSILVYVFYGVLHFSYFVEER